MVEEFSAEELDEIFENRFSLQKDEWNRLKSMFIDASLENLLVEEVNNIEFHVVYDRLVNMSDDEVFEYLLDECK